MATGIGIEGAFALPSGAFAPYSNVAGHLVVLRKHPTSRMFVAQLSNEPNANTQIVANFRQAREGGCLELGRFVEPSSFRSFELLRTGERLQRVEQEFGMPAVQLGELAIAINMGRSGNEFRFPNQPNAIFVPLIGVGNVADSVEDLTSLPQHYAQVVVASERSDARFVARFLNSDVGKEIRSLGEFASLPGNVPRFSVAALRELRIFIPDLHTQKKMLGMEARLAAEQNTLLGLQNELAELRRGMWSNPRSLQTIDKRLAALSGRLAGGLAQHNTDRLDQWFETLPFPLASILRAWQATPSQDFHTKHKHLLKFFEATAEFVSVILLSAFSSNEALFGPHKQKLLEAMQKQNLSFQRATFGTWKLVVEYLGKQTRELLSDNGKKPEDAKNDKSLCADIFADPSAGLPEALSRKELATILATTNKMRNDWDAHGPVPGQEDARFRNEQLLTEVQKLRGTIADTWVETQLLHGLHCRLRRDLYENEVEILMGSNTPFIADQRTTVTALDVEHLYLLKKGSGRALKLLPLVQVGPSPQSAKNACYFFNRLEKDGAKFVSYHFVDTPELKGPFKEASEVINFLAAS